MNLDSLLDDNTADVRVGFRPISVDARRALRQEVVPSKPAGMADDQFVLEMTEQLRAAVKDKDEWYTRLIRYKSIDQVDEAFFDDLIYVLGEWAQKQGVDALETPSQTPSQTPSAIEIEEAMLPDSPIKGLRNDLVDVMGPAHLTPWAFTGALNEVFTRHNLGSVKAQVVPASLEKMSTSIAGSKKCRFFVAVTIGQGFNVSQIDLRHFPSTGWFDPTGVGSPKLAAHNLVTNIVDAMF